MIKKFRKRSRREILKENLEALSSPRYLKKLPKRENRKNLSAQLKPKNASVLNNGGI